MRRLLLAVAVASGLLGSPSAFSAPAGAESETDPAPPAVGSCHDLTYDDLHGASSNSPPVPCSSRHTTLTFDVVEFAEPPDWNDEDSFDSEVYAQCNSSWVEVLGGNAKSISRSSYTYYWLMPTPAQREAGAAWVRCELALRAGRAVARLPQDVRLGQLPLRDSVALCRAAESTGYRVTVCARRHQYRATHSVRLPWAGWRSYDQAQEFAYRACDERIRGRFYYHWPSSRTWWGLGFRHATCLRKTRS